MASADRNYASVIGLDTDSKRTGSSTGAGDRDSDSGGKSTSSITGRVYDKSDDSPPANAQKQGRSSTVKESTYQKRY
ncbi:hypothetical protein LJK87_03720 [Paenibacillus sp. P25]|nr:hypothetical protein LJK87_03720 [Paenibacillus sp. P25]